MQRGWQQRELEAQNPEAGLVPWNRGQVGVVYCLPLLVSSCLLFTTWASKQTRGTYRKATQVCCNTTGTVCNSLYQRDAASFL